MSRVALWRWRLPHWRREIRCMILRRHEYVELEPGYAYCWYCGDTVEPPRVQPEAEDSGTPKEGQEP